MHFRSRRSAQIKLKKKQNLILKFRSSFKRNNAPATFPKPPQGEIPKTTRFILERLRENTNQMNARIDQILLLPLWKHIQNLRMNLVYQKWLGNLPLLPVHVQKHPLIYAISLMPTLDKTSQGCFEERSKILFFSSTTGSNRKETCNDIMVWIIRSEGLDNDWSWTSLTPP